MNRKDRVVYGSASGAVGGLILGIVYGLTPFGTKYIDDNMFLVGLVGIFLLGIAGAVKGIRKRDDSSLSGWIVTGVIATMIASIPILPILFFGLMFSFVYDYEGSVYFILAFLPVTYAMGAFGGFISGKIFQKIEVRHNSKKQ